jgi:hypothetical protein
MFPSSSITPVMGSVPVGVGAAAAAGLKLSAVFKSVNLALVKGTDVVARVAKNKRLSTATPITYFQKPGFVGFLVTGVLLIRLPAALEDCDYCEHVWAQLF